jgi:hypothetical protein
MDDWVGPPSVVIDGVEYLFDDTGSLVPKQ